MKNSKPNQKVKPLPTRIPKLTKNNAKPRKLPTPSTLPEIQIDNDTSYFNQKPNLDEWSVADRETPTKHLIPTNYDSMLKRYNISRGSPPLYAKERKVSDL
jgi:hypothetical protein